MVLLVYLWDEVRVNFLRSYLMCWFNGVGLPANGLRRMFGWVIRKKPGAGGLQLPPYSYLRRKQPFGEKRSCIDIITLWK